MEFIHQKYSKQVDRMKRAFKNCITLWEISSMETIHIVEAGMIGPPQIILIAVVLILLFGAKKIPELMKGVGKGIKEFKDASQEEEGDKKEESKK